MDRNTDNTWMRDALQRGDVAAVKQRVVDDPTHLSSRDCLGRTPLLTAIGSGNAELVEFMLKHGADPNVEMDEGYTCLLLAVASDGAESLRISSALIAAGADLHCTSTSGRMPLHMTAAWGEVEKACLLLEAGADVNGLTSDDQLAPLMEAARCGPAEMAQVLLERGADPTLRDGIVGRNALDLAVDAQKGRGPESHESIRTEAEETDLGAALAEADQLAREGNHERVIRVLREYAGSVAAAEPE
ncbi:MAG: ankryin [Armatimonadetes bacterium CG_4_10_14_3_um_filter_66_18]|nr:ankryin [Armatimonadota bacterium]PIU95015.1 MAG: ankryin [Armatimonadetes bacterium CG06_land_8_20_14_3_00_66_21]PIX39059.1 MAG: ankryin [Armatimonadetes bacterium CG_4_8_14_3_um_filter_66_20]PIY44980.1 MAG: ankryin [Armatimonadetes bacterium CG_4_10_14_3_um_filter_66_18]PIZ37490.1 MAG: ankryin [Armatimonadetes bacterium CG_4_10_14_0_8_um_filter_66_14]PJB73413.1 MAG: ankryin [Armatimonadetes bacterium CG_4_9_14_3_um_filter_66_14]